MIHTGLSNKILQFITGQTDKLGSSGLCYLGFSSSTPDDDGRNFSEPNPTTYPSYERIQLAVTEALQYTNKWETPSKGVVSNSEEFTSRECLEEGGWPEWTHFGIFDCKTGSVPLVSDYLRDPNGIVDEETGLLPIKSLTVEQGKVAVFRTGTLQLTLK